jgi:3-phosphoglycerate kinase
MADVKTVKDVDFSGKKVFVRVDFNVPLTSACEISDDTRIEAALPTIRYLIEKNAKVVLASHLGRPKGQKKPELSLKPIAANLSAKLGKPVAFVNDCIGADAEAAANNLKDGEVLLLENLRYYNEEEKNDPEFSKSLAKLADVYVNDAFGTAHRAHGSTEGITHYVDTCVAGLLIEKELDYLGDKTNAPEKPFTVILGGAKVSDKIKVIDVLLEKADTIIIGGAMAYTFALANGKKVGKSLSEPDKVDVAKAAMEKAKAKGVQFLLPVDTMVVDSLDFGAKTVGNTQIVSGDIPDGWEGVDIGPESTKLFNESIASAKTILWNGPMGIFEIDACSKGTFAVAEAVANSNSISIIGGGDSVKAIKNSGYSDKVTFMSTGGGASLEFLEGKILPGVAALDKK